MQWENGKCCKGKWGHALLSFGLRAPTSSRECRVRAQPLLFFRFIPSREPLTLSGSCSWSISQSRLWGYSGQHWGCCVPALLTQPGPRFASAQCCPCTEHACIWRSAVLIHFLWDKQLLKKCNIYLFFFFFNFLDSRHVFWEKPFAFRK